MAAMFSNSRSTGSSSGHIVEFKAGRSRLEPGSAENMRRVVAESTKGLVYIKQSNDMLIHFCWKDRESGALVEDLIIFPDDAEFKAVNGCPDGKVFMLKFKTSNELKLFWLQDSSSDADKDLVKKVNDAINKPPTTRPSASRASASNSNADRPSAGGTMSSLQDFQAPLGGLDQSQLMSLIQSLQGNNTEALPLAQSESTAAGAAPEGASAEADCEPPNTDAANAEANNADALTDSGSGRIRPGSEESSISLSNPTIQNILSNFRPNKKGVNVSLSEVLSNDVVAEVVRNHAEELVPHLPPTGGDPAEELADTVRTPQFRQAADTLGHALQTGQLGPVLSQFGMSEETVQAANQGDIRGFARSLTKAEGGPDSSGSTRAPQDVNKLCRKAVVPPAYLGFFSPSIAATVSRLENSDDDVTREPEPKRNRPDLDDMDVD